MLPINDIKSGIVDNLRISVVISAFNEEEVISKCLNSLSQQTLHRSCFEIIVVDDGSRDNTVKAAREVSRKLDLPIRLIQHDANRGLAAARNTGLSASDAEIVLFLDSDILGERQLLEEHVKVHLKYPANNIVVLGKVSNMLDRRMTPLMRFGDVCKQWERLPDQNLLGWQNFFGGNISIKKRFVISAGGFDEKFQRLEDSELGWRLQRQGMKMIYAFKAIGYHDHVRPPQKVLQNIKAYGAQASKWIHKNPENKADIEKYLNFGWSRGIGASSKEIIKRIIANRFTVPPLLATAKWFENKSETLSAFIYARTYSYYFRLGLREGIAKNRISRR